MKKVNHEYYVSLEVAELLKEAGFDWTCKHAYIITPVGDMPTGEEGLFTEYVENVNWLVKAPTLDVAQRWLREEKNINIEVKILSITSGQLMWYAKIYYLQKHNGIYDQVEFIQHTEISYDSYEQALEAGIKRALEIILEKG